MPKMQHADLYHEIKDAYTLVGAGVPWMLILQLLWQFGRPIVMQVLPLAVQALMAGASIQAIVAWLPEACLAAELGQPIPPPPGPAPAPA